MQPRTRRGAERDVRGRRPVERGPSSQAWVVLGGALLFAGGAVGYVATRQSGGAVSGPVTSTTAKPARGSTPAPGSTSAAAPLGELIRRDEPADNSPNSLVGKEADIIAETARFLRAARVVSITEWQAMVRRSFEQTKPQTSLAQGRWRDSVLTWGVCWRFDLVVRDVSSSELGSRPTRINIYCDWTRPREIPAETQVWSDPSPLVVPIEEERRYVKGRRFAIRARIVEAPWSPDDFRMPRELSFGYPEQVSRRYWIEEP